MTTAIMVHSADDARAALQAAAALNMPVTLISAPGAAGYAGAGYFQAMVAGARADFPDVTVTAILDCSVAAGYVLGALRQGVKTLRFTGDALTAAKLHSIARAQAATLITEEVPALDLERIADRDAACRAWLSRTG